MKKAFKLMGLALLASSLLFTACSKDDDDDNSKSNTENNSGSNNGGNTSAFTAQDSVMMDIIDNYVDNTVIYTYKQLAQSTETLVEELKTLRSTKSNINQVCETFLTAREWWEKSEAFLFGPAGNFGIDPHIDSWPLDAEAFDNLMANDSELGELDEEDGDITATGLNATLLGFHGLEYVLFKDGAPKNVNDISDKEMIFMIAVAGDLRNCCYRLAISWAGEDNVPATYAEKMEEAEWEYTVTGGKSFGQNMKLAGRAGSSYTTVQDAIEEIINGCIDIADEVGEQKIGTAHHDGASDEDKDYIESPYSQKSLVDFQDNIRSIENAYMGGVKDVNRNEAKSLHAFVKDLDASLDTRITTAIANAIQVIGSMPAPFVLNFENAAYDQAMEACAEVSEAMQALLNKLGEDE